MTATPWPEFPANLADNRLGVMRCCWGQTTFPEHCRLSAEIGAGFVEDFASRLTDEHIDEAEARDALHAAGIPLLLVIADHLDCDQPEAYCERLAGDIERWRRIGLTTFVTLRAARQADFDAFLKALQQAAAVVRQAGLMPVTQNHRGGRVESPEELAACRETGVALHFDTQQWPMAGHNALHAWDVLGPDVRHVHLGDRDAKVEGCPFGEGTVRMRELLRRMHATGYRGAMTVETEYGPNDAAAQPLIADALAFVRHTLDPFDAGGVDESAGHAHVAADAIGPIETAWGRLHWIANSTLFAGCGQTIGLITIDAGQSNGLHRHPDDQEVVYIRSGRCRHVCGEREIILETGDVLFIPTGQAHGAVALGPEPCEMLVTYPTGARSFEALTEQETGTG